VALLELEAPALARLGRQIQPDRPSPSLVDIFLSLKVMSPSDEWQAVELGADLQMAGAGWLQELSRAMLAGSFTGRRSCGGRRAQSLSDDLPELDGSPPQAAVTACRGSKQPRGDATDVAVWVPRSDQPTEAGQT
jgi:hypothetical protein